MKIRNNESQSELLLVASIAEDLDAEVRIVRRKAKRASGGRTAAAIAKWAFGVASVLTDT